MTIQVGVPGAAGGGGGGGGAVDEILAGSGSVKVNADGSITVAPSEEGTGSSLLTMLAKDADVVNSVRMEFRDSILRGTIGVARDGTDVNNAAVAGDLFLNGGSRLLLGTAGTNHILMVADVTRFDKATFHQSAGPHSWGSSFIPTNKQYTFFGNISLPGSDPGKFSVEGSMTGETGAQNYFGFRSSVNMNTQSLSEQVENMIGSDFPVPNIIDNLTGGQVIVNAATMRIRGAPTEATNNWALLIEAGLTALATLHQPVAESGQVTMGEALISGFYQYRFGGIPTLPSSNPKKFLVDGRITGMAGAQNYAGFESASGFITQAATEQISAMWGSSFIPPSITDNLTGGATIEEAATVRISAPPTGADLVWALLVQSGITKLQGALLVEGNLAVTAASISLTDSGSPQILIQRTGGVDLLLRSFGGTHALVGPTTAFPLHLITSNTDRIIIAANGAVRNLGDWGHEGTNLGFFSVTPRVIANAYTLTNPTEDRSFDADTVAVAELADVVATVIQDLINYGLLQAAGGG